ncbi:hypothetical protein RFI_33893 [Reticulomyxa filosa]|uniref:Uncharacterized protein n=1 Tax=Reticulomyxa filosa TaxID=46433 RepID=X6LQU3_RETFI|nr:hypothetical protein RFI_33893 [Reticulomyxa filosa]|eukprot:ETO03512.1 hypothetical protein RFI_33893 [Reticulomyxa filosa]
MHSIFMFFILLCYEIIPVRDTVPLGLTASPLFFASSHETGEAFNKFWEKKKEMAQAPTKVDPTEYRVPRNFKLLDELESAEKGHYADTKKIWRKQYVHQLGFGWSGLNIYTLECDHYWTPSIFSLYLKGMREEVVTKTKNSEESENVFDIEFLCFFLRVYEGRKKESGNLFVQKVDMPCVDAKGYVEFLSKKKKKG